MRPAPRSRLRSNNGVKVTSAEFIKSAFEKRHWVTGGLPEIAFLGRSNVGKSSLINSLLERKGLARTSNTPGRTQSINFFRVNDMFYFTDLPGYGFARVSKTMRADWGKMAEEYLSEREELALCIQLIDSRHEPTTLDVQLNDWLEHNDRPHLAVATKSDKLSNNELQKSIDTAQARLPGTRIIPYSSQTGRGRDEVWAAIQNALNNY
jgi:GTP-binding protein